jgi:hypothetical protein
MCLCPLSPHKRVQWYYSSTLNLEALRGDFLSNEATASTLLIEYVPKSLVTDEGIFSLFAADAGVVSVKFHQDASNLAKKVLERADLVKKIEGLFVINYLKALRTPNLERMDQDHLIVPKLFSETRSILSISIQRKSACLTPRSSKSN